MTNTDTPSAACNLVLSVARRAWPGASVKFNSESVPDPWVLVDYEPAGPELIVLQADSLDSIRHVLRAMSVWQQLAFERVLAHDDMATSFAPCSVLLMSPGTLWRALDRALSDE